MKKSSQEVSEKTRKLFRYSTDLYSHYYHSYPIRKQSSVATYMVAIQLFLHLPVNQHSLADALSDQSHSASTRKNVASAHQQQVPASLFGQLSCTSYLWIRMYLVSSFSKSWPWSQGALTMEAGGFSGETVASSFLPVLCGGRDNGRCEQRGWEGPVHGQPPLLT